MRLLELVNLWLSGQSVAGLDLWGLPVVWWARFGKLAQFTAGLTVVLDLIGPERLRAFGDRANRMFALRLSRFREVRARNAAAIAEWKTMWNSSRVKPGSGDRMLRLYGPVDALLAFVLVGGPVSYLYYWLHEWLVPMVPEAFREAVSGGISINMALGTLFLFGLLSNGALVTVSVLRGVLLVGFVFVFIRPVAAVLGRPGLRWFAVTLFVLGFGFDLLGS